MTRVEALPVPVLGNVSDKGVAEVEVAGGWLQNKLTRLGPCSPRGMSHLPSAERRGSTGELSSRRPQQGATRRQLRHEEGSGPGLYVVDRLPHQLAIGHDRDAHVGRDDTGADWSGTSSPGSPPGGSGP